jgi:hypothetical protein
MDGQRRQVRLGPATDEVEFVVRQLAAEYGKEWPAHELRRVAHEELAAFGNARILNYVGILAWRGARRRLSERPARQSELADEPWTASAGEAS